MIGERTKAELAAELKRLATERDEALARERALAEVLHVINSSPGDLTPVFDGLLDRALRLCRAPFGVLFRYDGRAMHLAAMRGSILDEAALEWFRMWVPEPDSAVGRILKGAPFLQISDVRDTDAYRSGMPSRVEMIDVTGARTAMWVALRHDDRLLGVIVIYRQEVRPFADADIALVRSFADQAVIAIENARPLNETREALDQQTATAEVLGVINSSPGDLQPVFDAMVERAVALCEADEALVRISNGKLLHLAAAHGEPDVLEKVRELGPASLGGHSQSGMYAFLDRGENVSHIADVRETAAYRDMPIGRARLDARNVRSWLAVALRKGDQLLGVINVHRHEVRPFSQKQIALLESFAAQAVIAIENARLLTETREALDQQTATAEVLQVINASPGNLAPVFDAMLEKAMRLCESTLGALYTYDGEVFTGLTYRGISPELAEAMRAHPIRPYPGGAPGRLVDGEAAVQIADLRETEAYRSGNYAAHQLVDVGGARTMLVVALRKDKTLLGYLAFHREEVHPYSDKQIALLQNFAAQAVIAMENARLLTETREALDQQTATAEVLGVINSSPGDLAPVFEVILEKAQRLCGVAFGTLELYDRQNFRAVATLGISDALAALLAQGHPAGGIAQPLIEGARYNHILDQAEHTNSINQAAVELDNHRTILLIPLRREDRLLGMLVSARKEVRAFTEKEITRLENFAAQAVIAMENARLINETREALEQQTATAKVLGVINSSPGDLTPVFEAIAAAAATLCDAANCAVFRFDGSLIHLAAQCGLTAAQLGRLRDTFPLAPGRGSITARAIMTRQVTHVPDLTADVEFAHPSLVESGLRGSVSVPMLREGVAIGAITVTRQESRSFSGKQIALLENFAAQAVIAIENARLITETQEALDQQTATAEVLGVINGSPGNLAPVFDAMLERAVRLCEADTGHLFRFENGAFFRLASRGVAEDFDELFPPESPVPMDPNSVPARMIATRSVVHVHDTREDESFTVYRTRAEVAAVEAGILTVLFVPLIKEGEVVGHFTMHRMEVKPFSEKQIALVENFAAQAVIAMENARLITETQEALDQQTATAEVLQVINANPGDLQPVFDVILEKAMALCDVAYGDLELYDGETFRAVATRGLTDAFAEQVRRGYPAGDNPATRRLIAGQRISHIVNMAEADFSKVFTHAPAKDEGHQTLLCVPLRRENVLLGMIACARREVRAFSEKEIALLESFAAQAVIAMENARLITETQEALEQQTATAEVLQVINSSPDDLTPVFDAILEKAHALCEVASGSLELFDGHNFHAVATRGLSDAFADMLRRGTPGWDNPLSRPLIDGEPFSQMLDVSKHEFPFPGGKGMAASAPGHSWAFHCAVTPSCSGSLCPPEPKSGRFPTERSRCYRISPRKR